jgi:cephalosporin hydroxylase
MKLEIDTTERTLRLIDGGGPTTLSLDSPEAFSAISRVWVTTGWSQKYTYGFRWMGRPIIQLPEDMVVMQEVIYELRPDVIVETGVAHGGSLVFYAGLCKAMGTGRVVGIDIEIRPHNRSAIEAHELFPFIELVEGSSTDPQIVEQVSGLIGAGETVLVILDSDHSRRHVTAELDAYAPMVTPGSYLVATDGVMEWLTELPGVPADWATDNPKAAVQQWLPAHPDFVLEDPPPIGFNEGAIDERITHWPGAYLRRIGTRHP